MQSKRYRLNRQDTQKIATGAGIAMLGALLTYLAEIVPNVDFGFYTPLAVATFAVLVNMVRKLMEGK